jgi:hypothetical protein
MADCFSGLMSNALSMCMMLSFTTGSIYEEMEMNHAYAYHMITEFSLYGLCLLRGLTLGSRTDIGSRIDLVRELTVFVN